MYPLDPVIGGPLRALAALIGSVLVVLGELTSLSPKIGVVILVLTAVASGITHFLSLGDAPEGEA